MNMTLAGLVEALRASLSQAVLPELQSDHARGQLAGVLDVLSKVERLAQWSPAMLAEQALPLQQARTDIEDRLTAAGHQLPLQHAAADGADALAAAEDSLRDLCDWLFAQASDLPVDLRAGVHQRLLAAMRESLVAERNRIPKADFSSMTASTS